MKYKVSVIIPIYNSAKFLADAIDSVINQTIGFNNIQLILINDGSKDNSEEICLKYKEKYPDNVLYIKQENAGVSAARNNGLSHVKGEYVNFIDSDDKWSKDFFEKALAMFEKNPEITSVWAPVKFFEAASGDHPLTYMFDKDRVIDMFKDYQYIKLSVFLLMKSEILAGRKFDSKIKIGEDAKFLAEIFMDHPKAGLISDSYYLYRKRADETSAMNGVDRKPTWYNVTPPLVWKHLMDLSKKKFGKVLPFIQWTILYDFQWRVFKKIPVGLLSEKEEKDYIKIIHDILSEIDPKIINECPYYDEIKKLNLLSFINYGKLKIKAKDDKVTVNGCEFDIPKLKIILTNKIINKDTLTLYCIVPNIPSVMDKVYLVDEKGKTKELTEYELDATNKYLPSLDSKYALERKGLTIKINLKDLKKISFAVKVNNKLVKLEVTFTNTFGLSHNFGVIYYKTNHYYIKYLPGKDSFEILKKNIKNGTKLFLRLYYHLLKRKRFKSIAYRIFADIYRLFHPKKIWLISDRINVANDNGEAFFEYVMREHRHDRKHRYYFAIKEGTNDYNRLKKKYGKNIVAYHSFKYKMLFLNSDKIISAQADNPVINEFGKAKPFVADKYRFDFVFLQHGITKDDLSPWLNVNNKKIDLFVCAAKSEYNSIVNMYNYNFPKGVAQLTGFARYDKLLNNDVEEVNSIIIAPTWRRYIADETDAQTGVREKNKDFKNTEYFKFYNDLINNKKLINYLKKKHYRIKFIPHINMVEYLDDFNMNNLIDVSRGTINYSKEFKQNKLLVTDFSSVFFDFVYLNKPVIYAQFDTDKFFEGQIYDKGYFDYKRDGFGPVVDTVDETVDEIIKSIDNNCKIDKKYEKRIKEFYSYTDQNNSKRIYEAIIKLDEE